MAVPRFQVSEMVDRKMRARTACLYPCNPHRLSYRPPPTTQSRASLHTHSSALLHRELDREWASHAGARHVVRDANRRGHTTGVLTRNVAEEGAYAEGDRAGEGYAED